LHEQLFAVLHHPQWHTTTPEWAYWDRAQLGPVTFLKIVQDPYVAACSLRMLKVNQMPVNAFLLNHAKGTVELDYVDRYFTPTPRLCAADGLWTFNGIVLPPLALEIEAYQGDIGCPFYQEVHDAVDGD
jgi:hypothetical protein